LALKQQSLTLFFQLFLTPVQRQLLHQLQEKSQQLQQAILRQQTELRQITQQLNLAKQGALPIPVMSVSHPVAVTTGMLYYIANTG
jgi:hypothetical protein